MQPLSAFAIYFIIWWFVLFLVLPFGIRSQVEEGERALGTERGAPVQARMVRKALITTLVSAVLFAVFYYVTIVLGYGVDDLPHIIPAS